MLLRRTCRPSVTVTHPVRLLARCIHGEGVTSAGRMQNILPKIRCRVTPPVASWRRPRDSSGPSARHPTKLYFGRTRGLSTGRFFLEREPVRTARGFNFRDNYANSRDSCIGEHNILVAPLAQLCTAVQVLLLHRNLALLRNTYNRVVSICHGVRL